MKDRKLLATINQIAFIINLAGGAALTALLMSEYENPLFLFVGIAFLFLAFVYKLVIDIWLDNGDNLARIMEMLEDKWLPDEYEQ